MATETGELKVLGEVSQDVRFLWTLGSLAELLLITKKKLRRALAIVKSPKEELEVVKKGKKINKTFQYGFNVFSVPGKNKVREICEPHPDLQRVYEAVKEYLEWKCEAHTNAYGFVRERNCKKGVETLITEKLPLLCNKHFFGLDIASAFPKKAKSSSPRAGRRPSLLKSFTETSSAGEIRKTKNIVPIHHVFTRMDRDFLFV